MQQVKRPDVPLDLHSFFDGIRMETKRAGYCTVNLPLISEHLESNQMQPTFSMVRDLAAIRNLTAVRVDGSVIFRKAMKQMEDVTEVLRAGGDVLCDLCHYAYKHHPDDTSPNDFLKVLCNGRRVKL